MLASLQATLPATLRHEIILIDDGSTDGTREWLQTLRDKPPIRVLLNDRNLGYAATNNRASRVATGDYLILLNNDLLLTPRWLEPMLRAHASLKAPGIIGNVQRAVRTQEIDHTGFEISEHGKPRQLVSLPLFPWHTKNVPAVTGACMLATRKLWNELGGFDERYLNGCEDIDLCFKALVAGYTNVVALRSSIFHHISPSPGRRRHDELNAQKLTLRWRSLLSELGARARCRDFLLRELNARAAYDSPWDCLQLGLHAAGFTRRAPIAGLRAISNALDTETSRWAHMLT